MTALVYKSGKKVLQCSSSKTRWWNQGNNFSLISTSMERIEKNELWWLQSRANQYHVGQEFLKCPFVVDWGFSCKSEVVLSIFGRWLKNFALPRTSLTCGLIVRWNPIHFPLPDTMHDCSRGSSVTGLCPCKGAVRARSLPK